MDNSRVWLQVIFGDKPERPQCIHRLRAIGDGRGGDARGAVGDGGQGAPGAGVARAGAGAPPAPPAAKRSSGISWSSAW